MTPLSSPADTLLILVSAAHTHTHVDTPQGVCSPDEAPLGPVVAASLFSGQKPPEATEEGPELQEKGSESTMGELEGFLLDV